MQTLCAHFMNADLQIIMPLDSLIPWLPMANKTNTLWNNDSLKYSFGLKPRRAMYVFKNIIADGVARLSHMYCLASQKCLCEGIAWNWLLQNNLPTFFHAKDQLFSPPLIKNELVFYLLTTSIYVRIFFLVFAKVINKFWQKGCFSLAISEYFLYFNENRVKLEIFFLSGKVFLVDQCFINDWDTECIVFILTVGGWSAADLHAHSRGTSGIQQTWKPQCSDVFSVSALSCTSQSGLKLELPSSKLYPFHVRPFVSLDLGHFLGEE